MSKWTQESIRNLLETNDKAVLRAILAINERQTADEQNSLDTKWKNHMGFSAAHARICGLYARWLRNGSRLSPNEMIKARKIMVKYTRQLTDIANFNKSNK